MMRNCIDCKADISYNAIPDLSIIDKTEKHKQADLGIISKEELRAYQIPEEGVVDNLTLKTKGAEILDNIL